MVTSLVIVAMLIAIFGLLRCSIPSGPSGFDEGQLSNNQLSMEKLLNWRTWYGLSVLSNRRFDALPIPKMAYRCLVFLSMGLSSISALQASTLVVVVQNEKAEPVKGMEVIHTDQDGNKLQAVFDGEDGVYRFAALPDGAGSVTAFKKGYRLAGVRWFLNTPDTVRIVSVKGGYLLYEEAGLMYWFTTDNLTAYISCHRYCNHIDLSDTLDKAGFEQTKNREQYVLQNGKPINPLYSNELEQIRNCKYIRSVGIVARVEKMKGKNGRPVEPNHSHSRENIVLTNQVTIYALPPRGIGDSQWVDLVDSLMKQYGLALDPDFYTECSQIGNPIIYNSMDYQMPFYLVFEGGVGACIIDQVRLLTVCPYVGSVILNKSPQNNRGHLDR